MTCLQYSPFFPPGKSGHALKGKIASNISLNNFVTITPFRGQGVNKCDNKLVQ
jgi:hypothetical protein